MPKQTILTGDRPTGPLHLGHYVGSLRSRVALQRDHEQFLLVADLQALTDNACDPGKVSRNVAEVVTDYLAVGIDPDLTGICLQSGLPALSEITCLMMNLVSIARLERVPTIKDEISQREFGRDVPAGFLCYPASQAADIGAFRATLVPAGDDQAPVIELSNEIFARINRAAGREVIPEARLLRARTGRLPAPDGKGKMSKSGGGVIRLGSGPDEIRSVVMSMFTDPKHLRVSEPGAVEGNVVFAFLDAFDAEEAEIAELKRRYAEGGLGDMTLKRRLNDVLQETVRPIRERRERIAAAPDHVAGVLRAGTAAAREVTAMTLRDVREAFLLTSS